MLKQEEHMLLFCFGKPQSEKFSLLKRATLPHNTCMRDKRFPSRATGFSLIQLVLSLSILALLTAVVISSLPNTSRAKEVERVTEVIVSMLGEARSRTLASVGDTQYGVCVTTTSPYKAVLFSGGGHDCISTANIVNEATFSRVTLTVSSMLTTDKQIVFQRGDGNVRITGTITIQDPVTTTLKRIITIDSSGSVTVTGQ